SSFRSLSANPCPQQTSKSEQHHSAVRPSISLFVFFPYFPDFISNKLHLCADDNLDIMLANDIDTWYTGCFNFILINFIHIFYFQSQTGYTIINCPNVFVTAKTLINLLSHHSCFIFFRSECPFLNIVALINFAFSWFIFFPSWCIQIKFHNQKAEQEIVKNRKYQALQNQHQRLIGNRHTQTQGIVNQTGTETKTGSPFKHGCNRE